MGFAMSSPDGGLVAEEIRDHGVHHLPRTSSFDADCRAGCKAKSPGFHRGFSVVCAGAISPMYHEVFSPIRVSLAA